MKPPFSGISAIRSRGLSLVELMVALTLGLVLVGGTIQIFVSNKQTYNTQEALSRLQENGRFAIEFLTQDIRMAGYNGCAGNSNTANVGNSVDSTDWMFITDPITGFNGGGNGETANTFPAAYSGDAKTYADPLPDPDSIIVRRGDADRSYVIDSHNPSSAVVHLTETHNLKQGEIVMIADPNCTQIGILQMTNVNNNDTVEIIDHNTGNATTPGNCTKKLMGNFTCSTVANAISAGYPPGSTMMRVNVHAYYIGLSSGIPSLYREILTQAGGNATTAAEELVQGVENMQVLYGYDSSAAGCNPATVAGCGVADQYLRADEIAAAGWGSRVVSVRIYLLLRTLTEVATSPQSYIFGGTTFTPTDRYLRREYSTTIQLRNRGAWL